MFHREFEFVNLYVSYRFTNTFTFTFTLVHFLKHRSYKLPPMSCVSTMVTVQMTRILNRPSFIDDNQLSCPRYYVNEWKIDLIAKSTLIIHGWQLIRPMF